MSEKENSLSCTECGTPLSIGCEHSKGNVADLDADARYELEKKTEREGSADIMHQELEDAITELEQAKAEMMAGDLDASWKTMERIEDKTRGIHIRAEKLRIALRLQSEQRKTQ